MPKRDDLANRSMWGCLQCNKRKLLLLWCFHKDGKNCPCEERDNKAGRGRTFSHSSTLIPLWTYCSLVLNTPWCLVNTGRHKTGLLPFVVASLSLSLLSCAGQKPKILSPNGLRPSGVFPLALSQSGSVSQSWGVTPMSRTWGLVRDTARLGRQTGKRWIKKKRKTFQKLCTSFKMLNF